MLHFFLFVLIQKRLWNTYIKSQSSRFIRAIFFMLLGALATAALPFLLQPVFDHVLAKGNIFYLVQFCSFVFLAFFLKGISAYGESVMLTHIGQSLISKLQINLFSHLIYSDLSFFHKNTIGDMISRMTNDVQILRQTLSNTIIGIGRDTITLICLLGVMLYRDAFLTFIALFVFPLCVFPVIKLGKRMKKATSQTQEHIGALISHIQQILGGIRVVKTYLKEGYEKNKVGKIIENILQLAKKTGKTRALSHPLMEIVAGFAIVSVIAYGGVQVMNHARTTGEFISFIGALLLIYEPIKRLTQLNTNIQEAMAAAERIFEFLDTPILIQDNPQITYQKHSLIGDIEFKNICFSYNKEQPLFENFNLAIKQGSSVAFVGQSGSGKTTLLNLIPRFYDVQRGEITINNINIKDLSLENLRENIALVSQDIVLFNGTLYENIAYGKEDASEEEVIQAAKASAIHDFIQTLPLGYKTQIGENGMLLSGGQRQRLSIARAILKNAPILLLDEATASLDTVSEKKIQESITALMIGKTTITIAHRLSTIQNSDIIYVFDKGKIIEKGSHKELIEKSGYYKRLSSEIK